MTKKQLFLDFRFPQTVHTIRTKFPAVILHHIRVRYVHWHQNLMTGIRTSQKEETLSRLLYVQCGYGSFNETKKLSFSRKNFSLANFCLATSIDGSWKVLSREFAVNMELQCRWWCQRTRRMFVWSPRKIKIFRASKNTENTKCFKNFRVFRYCMCFFNIFLNEYLK